MRKVLVIARRDYLASVRTKSFLVGIILMPILMSGGAIAQRLLRDQVDVRPKHFAIVDRTPGVQIFPVLQQAAELQNRLQADPESGKPRQAPFILEKAATEAGGDIEALRLALSERVRSGELIGFLEIGAEVLQAPPMAEWLKARQAGERPETSRAKASQLEPYGLRYQTNRPAYLDFPKWAEVIVTTAVQTQRALQEGVAPATVVKLIVPVPLFTKGLTTINAESGAIRDAGPQSPVVALVLPGGLLVLMFMVVLLGAAPMMQGLIEEKMQRIAEVLLGSVRPFQLMLGKLVGMAGVSLTLATVYLGGAYAAVHHYGYAEYLSLDVILWFLLYLVLSVFMFGSIYAAVGAACTDMKEAQAMLTPVTLVTMIPLFVWVNVIREPTSTFATLFSFFPPATPMLMVGRLAAPPGLPWWQPALGVILVLATTLVCVYAAGRVFRVGILLSGKAPRFGEMLRWVVRG
jgi:ABC-2 type transport system permease protein